MLNFAQKISYKLKKQRLEKGWSLATASIKTGVSKAMLGQIERGESSPTIATLWKIASGFDTSFSYFIEDEKKDSLTVFRNDKPKKFHPKDDKILATPLFPYDEKLSIEIFIIELLPGCEHLSPPHAGTVIEHVIATSGEMEVLINKKWHKLRQNEGLKFNANQPHGYRNLTTKKITFNNIIHYGKNYIR